MKFLFAEIKFRCIFAPSQGDAWMAELVDAHDSKSCVLVTCGFDSHSGYKSERKTE